MQSVILLKKKLFCVMINILDLLGRILISALFFLNGIFKINNYEGTITWMESFGLPGFLIIPAILLEIAGPILIVIGYKTKMIFQTRWS